MADRRPLLWLSLAYLVAIFPFAFFRHDDWMNLGGMLQHFGTDWTFAYRPVYDHLGSEASWFFRPSFKLILYALYRIFGLNYFAWLCVGLIGFLCTLIVGGKLVHLLTGEARRGQLFITTMCAAIYVHFWSLAWAGEGLMNIPLVLFVTLNTYFFVKSVLDRRRIYTVGAVGSFAIALTFKESAAFQLFWLTTLAWIEPSLARVSKARRWGALAPHYVLGSVYLFVRLVVMPISQSYAPVFSWRSLLFPMGIFFAAFCLPTAVYLLTMRAPIAILVKELQKHRRWIYFALLSVAVAPYFFHDFFSAGWILQPGLYFAMAFAKTVPIPKNRWIGRRVALFGIILLIVSTIPVGASLVKQGWWKWGTLNRRLVEAARNAPDSAQYWEIELCGDPDSRWGKFSSVVGDSNTLYHIWKIYHPGSVSVDFLACNDPTRLPAEAKEVFRTRFEFPEFSVP